MANSQRIPDLPPRPRPEPSGTGTRNRPVEKSGRTSENDSLASILNFDERSDLVNLVDNAALSVRNAIAASFEVRTQSENLLIDLEETEDPLSSGNPAAANLSSNGGALKERSDICTPEILALKRSTLKWHDKWRDAVLRRVCEAVNTRWQPIGSSSKQTKMKEWDELSWDDDPSEKTAALVEPLSPAEQEDVASLHNQFPPIPSPLATLDREKRLLVLHSVLLLLLSLKHYYAPSRILLLRLASSMHLTIGALDKDEESTASLLVTTAKALTAATEVEKKAQENQASRKWKVLGASIAGAAVIGLTGGLAAPLVAAGIGTVMGGLGLGATAAAGLLGSVAGSSVLVGGLFGAYGARMTGQMIDQYAREVSDFAFVPLRGKLRVQSSTSDDPSGINPQDRRLRITIGISGWLNEKNEVISPWRVLGTGTEVFALRWELEALLKLGSGMSTMVTSAAWSYAKLEILKRTVFASILGAVMLPVGLLQLGSLVDNPFRVAQARADKAGEVLADALISRAQGERPVSLLGYSLGARLIYSCLQSLAKRRAFGLVESVVLLGAPIPSSSSAWRQMRSVVSGRLVNVYSENDYVLGFLYRANSIQLGVAGLQEISQVTGVENCNVSKKVTGHLQYRYLLGQVLKDIGWGDLDEEEIASELEALNILEREEADSKKRMEIQKDKKGDQANDEFINLMKTEQRITRAKSEDNPLQSTASSTTGSGREQAHPLENYPDVIKADPLPALKDLHTADGYKPPSSRATYNPSEGTNALPMSYMGSSLKDSDLQHPTARNHGGGDDDSEEEHEFKGIRMIDND